MAMEDQMQAGTPEFEQALAELAQLLQRQQPTTAVPAKSGPMPKEGDRKWFEKLGEGPGVRGNSPFNVEDFKDTFNRAQNITKDKGVLGDVTGLTSVTNALVNPSGPNTVAAGLSMLPLASKLPTKPLVAGLGALVGGGLMQADAADQQNGKSPGLINELATALGFDTRPDRDKFRQKWENQTPAPQQPGTKEDYLARARQEFENSPAYKARVEKGQLKTAQQELAAYLDKIAKSGEYEKKVSDYDTRIKSRDSEFNTAYDNELANQEKLRQESWQKPFNQRHPDVAGTLLASSFAAPAFFGWRNAKQTAKSRNALLDGINTARTTGDDAALNLNKLALEKFEEKAPKNELASMAKSAAVPFELRGVQNLYDYGLAPNDSEAKKAAVSAYDPTNPANWAKLGTDVLSGGVSWLGGNQLGKHIGKDPNLNKAKSAAELDPRSTPPAPTPPPAPATPPPVPLKGRTPAEIDARVEEVLNAMKNERGHVNLGGYKNHDELRSVIRKMIDAGQIQ